MRRGGVLAALIMGASLAGCGDEAVKYTQGLKQDVDRAHQVERKADLTIVGVAIRAYQAKHDGANPPTLQALVDDGLLQSVPAGVDYDPATATVK